MKWAKKALISLLSGGKLPSDAPIPHPSAIDALMTLPRVKVVLLVVAYHAIGICQQRLGLPCSDAFDTSVAIESRLLQAQRVKELAELALQHRLQEEAVSSRLLCGRCDELLMTGRVFCVAAILTGVRSCVWCVL